HQLPRERKDDLAQTEVINRAKKRAFHIKSVGFATALQLIACFIRERDGDDPLIGTQLRYKGANLAGKNTGFTTARTCHDNHVAQIFNGLLLFKAGLEDGHHPACPAASRQYISGFNKSPCSGAMS